MSKNTGGPAFPGLWIDYDSMGAQAVRESYPGMTLRDYFAAKAMQGLVSSAFKYLSDPEAKVDNKALTDEAHRMLRDIGPTAYMMADAMIAARESE